MHNFEIFTDSSCDLPKDFVERFGLKILQLEVIIDDNPPVLNNQIEIKDFYDQLRAGALAKTAAVTPGYVEENMRKSLEEGRDILYLGFSSGLSTTYNNAVMMMEELQHEFPERKLLHIDTLCASLGQGLLVYYAALQKEKGVGIEELHSQIEVIKNNIHHQVTVNDLFFLKRGGRIDAVTAIAGSMLNIKPIIHMDENGCLQTIGKVRGRKNALKELVTKMKANEKLEEFGSVFICHSDCLEDAKILEQMVREAFNVTEVVIGDIGPVIGAHTGPGTVALFYLGTNMKGH